MPRVRAAPAPWVEQSVYIDGRNGSVPGFYSHDRYPYSRGVLDAFADPYVEQITLRWGTQLGKTTNIGSLVAWVACNNPAPTMIACANEAAAQSHYKTKLEPMLESVAETRQRLPAVKNRRSWKIVNLGNMWIWYAWPGSKPTISDRSIKYLFINEVSLWDVPMGQEGDPVQMIFDRTKDFGYPGRKIVVEGKPTIEGECRLSRYMDVSRQHEFYVPCPACGHYQTLNKGKSGVPGGIKWEADYDSPHAVEQAVNTVHWECQKCLVKHSEKAKPRALRNGVWVPRGQEIAADGKLIGIAEKTVQHCGYQLNSFYSRGYSWTSAAKRWVEARSNVADLQAVVNGMLGETWKIKQRRTRSDEVQEHKEGYKLGTVPQECLCVVMCIDVQEDSFWYTVRAWSWYGNSHLVTYGVAKTWTELEAIRQTQWEGKKGELHRVFLTLIDSAYRTNEVYDWCRERAGSAIPIRGAHQYTQMSMVRRADLPTHGIELWHIDAGFIRDQFYDARLIKRNEQPGAWMFPQDVKPDYIRSICSWQREEKKVGQRMKRVWVSNSPGFEHFADTEFMQEAFAAVYDLANRRPPEAKPDESNDPQKRAWLVTQRS